MLICGDRKAEKAAVARLIELIPGLRAVNAGPLEMARIVEQLTPMLISVNSPLQDPRGDPADRNPRRRPLELAVRVALLAGGTGGAKLGAGHAGGDRRRAERDRQHRR